jgi:uncharacterized membrane protein
VVKENHFNFIVEFHSKVVLIEVLIAAIYVMVRSTVVVAVVLLVIIESTFVDAWWGRRRRNCRYPKPRQGNYGP